MNLNRKKYKKFIKTVAIYKKMWYTIIVACKLSLCQCESMNVSYFDIGRTSRGVSGALYLQSAVARVNSLFEGYRIVLKIILSDVDVWVLRNIML